MESPKINHTRRKFLIASTSAVGAVGIGGAATPFVRSWNPSEKALSLGAPLSLDISQLREGEMLGPIQLWRSKPIFVFKRSSESLEILKKDTKKLLDPDSQRKQQPEYASNYHRSHSDRPDIGVLIGLCTHLGCSPKFYGEVKPEDFEQSWQGGFYCPCHGSRFDMAGRVYEKMPAPANLEVPPYSFVDENILIIGVEGDIA